MAAYASRPISASELRRWCTSNYYGLVCRYQQQRQASSAHRPECDAYRVGRCARGRNHVRIGIYRYEAIDSGGKPLAPMVGLLLTCTKFHGYSAWGSFATYIARTSSSNNMIEHTSSIKWAGFMSELYWAMGINKLVLISKMYVHCTLSTMYRYLCTLYNVAVYIMFAIGDLLVQQANDWLS